MSCISTPQKQTKAVKADTLISVQNNILGIELGKTTISNATEIIAKSGWQYELFEDGSEVQMSINTPINFGDIDWDSVDFLFLKHKAYMALFSESNCKHNKEQEYKRFQIIAKQLQQRYPKSKLDNKNNILTYSDSTYLVTLEIDQNNRGLMLTYEIEENKIDKIIGSEL